MARYVWAKVYTDFLRHPKLYGRPDSDKVLWLGLILHAKEHCPDGIVRDLSPEDMKGAFGIKASVQKIVEGITYFETRLMLERLPDGGLLIKDFVERQDAGGGKADEPTTQGGNLKRLSKVYFIRAATSGRIKIGFSQNPWARLRALQTSSSEPLELVTSMPGGVKEEQEVHKKFAHLRVNREWFTAGPDLVRFISDLPKKQHATRSTTGSATRSSATEPLQQEGEVEVDPRNDRSSKDGESEGKDHPTVDNSEEISTLRLQELAQAQVIKKEKARGFSDDHPVENPVNPSSGFDFISESDRLQVKRLFAEGKGGEASAMLARLQREYIASKRPESVGNPQGGQS